MSFKMTIDILNIYILILRVEIIKYKFVQYYLRYVNLLLNNDLNKLLNLRINLIQQQYRQYFSMNILLLLKIRCRHKQWYARATTVEVSIKMHKLLFKKKTGIQLKNYFSKMASANYKLLNNKIKFYVE